MKIALSHWQGRIAPVFDVAENILLVDTRARDKAAQREARLVHRHEWARAKELSDLKVEMLICGAISRTLEKALVRNGVQVYGFICGDIRKVLAAVLEGSVDDRRLRMPGARSSNGKGQAFGDEGHRDGSN